MSVGSDVFYIADKQCKLGVASVNDKDVSMEPLRGSYRTGKVQAKGDRRIQDRSFLTRE